MGIDDADDDVFEPERADGTGSCFAGGFAGEHYRDGGVARTGRRHFQRRKLHDHADPLAPTISGIAPTSIAVGSTAFPLTVTGTNFTNASTVMWGTNGADDDVCEPDAIDGAGDCGAGGRAGECFGDGGDACAGRRDLERQYICDRRAVSDDQRDCADVGHGGEFCVHANGERDGLYQYVDRDVGIDGADDNPCERDELTVQVMAAQVAAQGTRL